MQNIFSKFNAYYIYFRIHGPDGRLLMADGSHFFELSVPDVELHAAWTGVTFIRQHLHTEKIYLEGDSATVIT